MLLVQEHRLGRVGALMWSSYASAASILVLATTTRVAALFAVVSLLVLFFSGERERESLPCAYVLRCDHVVFVSPRLSVV